MNPRIVSAALLVLGGVLMLVASFLTWATVTGPNASLTVNGFNVDGYITDIFAVVFLIFGIAISRGVRTWLAVLATVFTVLGVGWGILIFAAISNFSSLYPDTSTQGVSVSAGLGIIVVLVGTILAFIGAIASYFGRTRAAAAGTTAPPAPA